jgi:hypothetical protein
VAELTDEEWARLAHDLAERVAVSAPGWTDQRDDDPGVTVVELMAFLGQSMLRWQPRSQRALSRLRDVMSDVEAAHALPCTDLPTPTRVRYFSGQLLSSADFDQEQAYLRDKQRLHNRLLHGTGIVRGLEVTVEDGDDGRPIVAISPGVAIAPDGEELVVCAPLTSAPCSGRMCYVALRRVDRPLATEVGGEASRVEEGTEIGVAEDVRRDDLAIARLERVRERWQVDPAFKPERAGR